MSGNCEFQWNYPKFPPIPVRFSQIPASLSPQISYFFQFFRQNPPEFPQISHSWNDFPFFFPVIPMSQQLPRDPSGILPRGRAGPGPGLQGTGSPEPPAGEKMGKILEFQSWENSGRGVGKRRGFQGVEFGVLGEFFQGHSHFRGSQRNFSRSFLLLKLF